MRSKRFFRSASIIATLAVALSIYEFWRAHRLQAQLAIGAQELVVRRDRLKVLREQTKAASRPAEPVKGVATAPPALIPAGLQPKRELSRNARMVWGRRLVKEHPEIRELAVEYEQATFQQMYRDFPRLTTVASRARRSPEARVATTY